MQSRQQHNRRAKALRKEDNMTRGFLLVDQAMNTVIIPIEDEDLNDWMKYKVDMSKVHEHKTLKDLDADVRAYLRGKYVEEEF